jgi:predicted ATPase/DNA-binding CsgD family transcriptional regulator
MDTAGGPLARAGVTGRETEVLAAVAQRLSNREIAERLFLSVRTVESHVSALLRKLGAPDRAGLARLGAKLLRAEAERGLPEPVTSFVGREPELRAIGDRLGSARLVTLIGPGGVGKTRLALRLAATSGPAFGDGSRFADLAAVASGDLVAATLARALGLLEQPGRTLEETLLDAAGHLDVLLIVDNCEHVIDEVARVVARIIAAAARLVVLATSREPLGVPGEVVTVVDPLPLDDAVRLFADRAASAAPGLALEDANPAEVADLCRRLDGLPLALELAAARVRTFAPAQLLANLDRRFDLLTAGARAAAPRHRTLEAALDWSYETLDDDERTLFARLAVFEGTFGYEAVEAVAGAAPLDRAAIIRVFPRLLDKSLVSAQRGDAGAVGGALAGLRYRLLETVRAYAGARVPPDPLAALRARHAAHYRALAERAAPQLRSAGQAVAFSALAAEQPNLRAALAFSADSGDVEGGLRLVAALALFWDAAGQRREAQGWIRRLLAAGDPPPTPASVDGLAQASFLLQRSDADEALRAAALAAELAAGLGERERAVAALATGWALAYRGRRAEAAAALGPALAWFDAAAHPWQRAVALQGLALATGDLDDALEHAQRAVELFREAGDLTRVANTLYTMADGALNAGARLADAERWLSESLALGEAAGSEHDRVHALFGLARLAVARASFHEAEVLVRDCLPALRRLGDQRCGARALYLLGELAARGGDEDTAARLWRESVAAAEPAADADTLARAREALRAVAPEP